MLGPSTIKLKITPSSIPIFCSCGATHLHQSCLGLEQTACLYQAAQLFQPDSYAHSYISIDPGPLALQQASTYLAMAEAASNHVDAAIPPPAPAAPPDSSKPAVLIIGGLGE